MVNIDYKLSNLQPQRSSYPNPNLVTNGTNVNKPAAGTFFICSFTVRIQLPTCKCSTSTSPRETVKREHGGDRWRFLMKVLFLKVAFPWILKRRFQFIVPSLTAKVKKCAHNMKKHASPHTFVPFSVFGAWRKQILICYFCVHLQ